jgi:hypothetical protein
VVKEESSFELAGADFPISPQVSRLRYQAKWQRPIFKDEKETPFYFSVGNEVFISLGETIKAGDRFDQNRLAFSLGYKLHPSLKIEMGYLNHWVVRKSDPQLNHCITLNLIFENTGALFHGDTGGGD